MTETTEVSAASDPEVHRAGEGRRVNRNRTTPHEGTFGGRTSGGRETIT